MIQKAFFWIWIMFKSTMVCRCRSLRCLVHRGTTELAYTRKSPRKNNMAENLLPHLCRRHNEIDWLKRHLAQTFSPAIE